jgi:hypothetical protein
VLMSLPVLAGYQPGYHAAWIIVICLSQKFQITNQY